MTAVGPLSARPRLRTVRSRRELDRILATTDALEPRSTLVNGALRNRRRREVRVAIIEDDGGRIVGVGVATRECLDVWDATPLVLEAGAAEPLARWLDAGPARTVVGLAGDVDPIAPHLRRARSVGRMPWYAVHAPVPELPPELLPRADERPRLATVHDVRGLARVYEAYELDAIPTMLQLRRNLRRSIRRGLVVLAVEEAGRIVAASRVGVRTPGYTFWTDSTVLPSHRRRGYWWLLTVGAREVCADLGVGFIGTAAPTSSLPNEVFRQVVSDMGGTAGEFVTVRMSTPLRFRGQGRLRRLLRAIGGRRTRRKIAAAPDRDPDDAG